METPTSSDTTSTLVDVTDETEIAQKLRALLERLGMTASEFARQTGLSQAYLSKLKTGDRGSDPKKALALRVAARETFGVPDIYWHHGTNVELPQTLGPGKLRPMNIALIQQNQQLADFKRQLAS